MRRHAWFAFLRGPYPIPNSAQMLFSATRGKPQTNAWADRGERIGIRTTSDNSPAPASHDPRGSGEIAGVLGLKRQELGARGKESPGPGVRNCDAEIPVAENRRC